MNRNTKQATAISKIRNVPKHAAKILAVYVFLVIAGTAALVILFSFAALIEGTPLIYVTARFGKYAGFSLLNTWLPALLLGLLWSSGVVNE